MNKLPLICYDIPLNESNWIENIKPIPADTIVKMNYVAQVVYNDTVVFCLGTIIYLFAYIQSVFMRAQCIEQHNDLR